MLFEGKQDYGHANHFYDEMEKRLNKGMSNKAALLLMEHGLE
ncbi:hypothetical protein [Candidatus Protochlamydia phocaeensis]|nr:hypothetical protein [Candidatus Protochlamydia phocaeensis]